MCCLVAHTPRLGWGHMPRVFTSLRLPTPRLPDAPAPTDAPCELESGGRSRRICPWHPSQTLYQAASLTSMTISHVYLKIRILSHCALLPVQAATSEQVCKHGLRAHVYRPTSLHFGSFLGQGCIAGSSGTGKKASVPNTRRRLPTHPATGRTLNKADGSSTHRERSNSLRTARSNVRGTSAQKVSGQTPLACS